MVDSNNIFFLGRAVSRSSVVKRKKAVPIE